MKIKVLIIEPPDPPGERYTREMRCQERREVLGTLKPPLTPALLCALFEREGVPFAALEGLSAEAARAELRKRNFDPDLILFPTCTPTVSRDMEFAARLKRGTAARTAAFGSHTSGAPELTLEQFPELDIAIVGEPEETALELVRVLGEGRALESVPGVVCRDANGAITAAPARAGVADLDALPMPEWRHFELSRYRVPLFGKKFLLVEISRGCPHGCGFCVVPLTHGGKVREKSPERIVEEIAFMKKTHGVSFFYFWGDTAIYRRGHVEEMCELLIKEKTNIEWISNTRPEAVTDSSIAQLLRRGGCLMLSMGAESADPGVLDAMGKKLDPGALRRAVRLLRGAGIRSFVFFMFGYPGETKATMKKTADFAIELDPDYANFSPVTPYPGTPLYRKCVEQGLLASDEWRRVDYSDYVLNPPGLPRDTVMRMVRRARRRFYMRPALFARAIRDLSEPARALDLIRAMPAYFDL